MKSLTIRVSDEEHALMQAAASKRFMTITGIVRAHFHSIFEVDGTLPAQNTAPAAPSNSRVTWRPIPQGPNAWRAAIYARINSGESYADVAESYGVAVQIVKDKYKAARDDMQYHIDAGVTPSIFDEAPAPAHETIDDEPDEPELVYDPVDPDNPTEEEQAIHAEIARRKLLAMGFTL